MSKKKIMDDEELKKAAGGNSVDKQLKVVIGNTYYRDDGAMKGYVIVKDVLEMSGEFDVYYMDVNGEYGGLEAYEVFCKYCKL